MANTAEDCDPLLSGVLYTHEEHYNTFNVQAESIVEAAISAPTSTDDRESGQSEQDVLSGSITAENNEFRQPRRNICSKLSLILSSNKPLKYLVIVFGMWSELGCCCLVLIISIALSILPAQMILLISSNMYPEITVSENCGNGCLSVSSFSVLDVDRFIILICEVPPYLVMIYCIRRLSKHQNVLRLKKAFQLAKKSKWTNLLLIVSLIMIATSVLPRNCSVPTSVPISLPTSLPTPIIRISVVGNVCPPVLFLWRIFLSIVLWQAIISCFVFGIEVKALIDIVEQCLSEIFTSKAASVNHYIDVHQKVCRTIESTFAVFKKWFIVNTSVYFVVLVWLVIRMFSLSRTFFGRDLVPNNNCIWVNRLQMNICSPYQSLLDFQYYFTFLLYASFTCGYPWSCVGSLKTSLNRMIQKLNSKTDWSPHHPFRSRSQLNDFLQYVNNTTHQPFMLFTCSAKIPYISVLLAICGLTLTMVSKYRENQLKTHQVMMMYGNVEDSTNSTKLIHIY